MKSFLLIFSLVFLLNFNSICQYSPDSSSIWTIALIEMGSYKNNSSYSLVSDTTINDLTYKTIYVSYDSVFNNANSFYHSAFREIEGKWLFVPKGEAVEYLLYDFNVKTGETVTINNPWTNGEKDLIVFKTDSIELSDGFHKYFEVGDYDKPSGQPYIIDTWIKGIGSPNGVFYSGFSGLDFGYRLLCYHNLTDLVYLNSPDGTCGYIKLSNTIQPLISDIKISPNPSMGIINIDSKENVLIEIYDITGIKRIKSNYKSIDISCLETGIYFVKVFNSAGQFIKTEKILRQ